MSSDPTALSEAHSLEEDSTIGVCKGHSQPQPPMVKRGRLSVNLAANAANFGVNMLVQVWFTAYLIRHLGVAGYGLVPLTTQVVSYLSLVTLAINTSVARFLTISLERDEVEEANRILNTSLFGSILVALVLAGPGLYLAANCNIVFKVPAEFLTQARCLFGLVVATFLISSVTSPFEVASYCRNRFDLRNAVQIGATLIRTISVVVLFACYTATLWHVGLGMVIAAVLAGFASIRLCRHLIPILKVSIRQFDWHVLKELTTMGWWIVVSQLGTLMLLSTDLLLVNWLFEPQSAGHYAAILQWSILLRVAAGSIASTFGPTMLYYYARTDIDSLIRYSGKSVRLLGLLMILPTSLVCGFSRPLLYLWLGPNAVPLAPLMTLMTVHLSLNLGYLPVHNISMARNNVKIPGIVQIIAGVVNLGLALFLAKPMGWGMYGIAAAFAIVLTIRNIVFTPIYAAHIIGRRYDVFLKEVLPLAFCTILLGAACWHVSSLIDLRSWGRFLVASLGVTLFYGVGVLLFLLSREERKRVLGSVPVLRRIVRGGKND